MYVCMCVCAHTVMEYVARGAVMKGQRKSKPLLEALARKYFRQLITGLEYCK